MRVSLEPAYVLHSRPYRESSALVDVLTQNHGRVGLVARGARSRWKNMLQPFRPLLLSWTQRTELGTLTGADQVASPPVLAGDALFCGMYVNELLVRFLQRSDPHVGLFEQYSSLLGGLAGGEAPQPLLRLFEHQLLTAVGFGLQLEHESGSERAIRRDTWYRYEPESGPIRQEPGSERTEDLISGAALLALKSGCIGDEHLRELKALMRRLIRFHLGDREIRSQRLFS